MTQLDLSPEARLAAEAGCWHLPRFLTDEQQDFFVAAARGLKTLAPMVSPRMRDGTPLSVKVSSFGHRGWWSDQLGYRYVEAHPTTGAAWPPIPMEFWGANMQALAMAALHAKALSPGFVHEAWARGGIYAHADRCDTCLVNFYAAGASLGWHVDRTEKDQDSPIVTFSVGATASFDIRFAHHGELVTHRYTVRSGDAIVMAGRSRLAEHRVHDLRAEDQSGLFAADYNPIRESKARLSFTIRNTGL